MIKICVLIPKDFDNLLIKACEVLRKRRYVLTHTEAILVDEVKMNPHE